MATSATRFLRFQDYGLSAEGLRREMREGKLFNVPNLLALVRMALVWPMWRAARTASLEANLTVLLLVALALATDLIDGHLARKLGQETMLGKIVDPLADKTLLLGLALLVVKHRQFPRWAMTALIAVHLFMIAAFAMLVVLAVPIPGQRYWSSLPNMLAAVASRCYLFGAAAMGLALVKLSLAGSGILLTDYGLRLKG